MSSDLTWPRKTWSKEGGCWCYLTCAHGPGQGGEQGETRQVLCSCGLATPSPETQQRLKATPGTPETQSLQGCLRAVTL